MTLNASMKLRRDSRGQVLPLFVISSVALLGLMGLGMDGARGFMERRQAQGAADLASLAGARSLPDDPVQAEADARSLAAANGYTSGVTVTFPDDNRIRVVINSGIEMLFLSILGMDSMEVDAAATAVREPEVTGESVPLSGPAILAHANLCGSAGNDILKWSGATATINGDVITNSGGDISGTGNQFFGNETYYDTAPTCDNQFTVKNGTPNPPTNFQPVATTTDYPLDPTLAPFANVFAPGGLCNASTSPVPVYFMGADEVPSALPGNYNTTTKQITNGVYCRVNNTTTPTALVAKVNLKTAAMWCDRCTFVALNFQATGAGVTLTSPAIAVTPPDLDGVAEVCDLPDNTCGGYPLLIYATYTGSKAVNYSGNSAVWNGLMFTPFGHAFVSGHDSTIYDGAVWGDLVEVSGASFTLNGPTEWGIMGGGGPLPEVLALVE